MAAQLAKKFIPLMDRVLVQKIRPAVQTKSGLYLPESAAKHSAQFAKVLAVGPGAFNRDGKRTPVDVKTGDTVIVPEYGGMPVKVEEEELHVFRSDDLVAIVADQ